MALLLVKTQNGWVEGQRSESGRVAVFRGIPYAKAPLGALRWREPMPAEDWPGVRKAYTYSKIPVQPGKEPGSMYQRLFFPDNYEQSEDCLYINVWTPAKTPADKLPVAVWIYGGGYNTGFANKLEFDGETFAGKGCVYVSFNYRVGIMGFLAHPELSAEGGGRSGNYGFLDQIAALRWVRANIEAFGGDPEMVTILGQSVGAFSCMNLSCSPCTEGLFGRVVCESSAGLHLELYRDIPTLEKAEKMGEDFLQKMGIASIHEARQLHAQELMRRLGKAGGNRAMLFQPNVDGCYLPENPVSCIMNNRHHKLDYLLGSTENEGYAFQLGVPYDSKKFADEQKRYFQNDTDCYLKAVGYEETGTTAPADTFGDFMLSAATAWNELELKRNGKTAYQYFFAKTLPGEESGAFHSAEHAYIFQTLNRFDLPYQGSDFELSRMMCAYWTNFIKTGDPNGEGLPEWRRYHAGEGRILELGENVHMIDMPERPGAKFMVDYMLRLAEKTDL